MAMISQRATLVTLKNRDPLALWISSGKHFVLMMNFGLWLVN